MMLLNLKQRSWIGFIVVLNIWGIQFFGNFEMEIVDNFTLSTMSTACVVAAFQIYRKLFPKFKSKPYLKYQLLLWFLVLSIAMVAIEYIIDFEFVKDEIVEFGGFAAYIVFTSWYSILFIGFAMFVSWGNEMAKQNKQKELEILKLAELNKETKLSELKRQLNPHFLFNALSNIYSIAYLGDKETPNKIMQLSKMLRYVIYDTDVESVSLLKEIDYLKDYIDFQRFKIKRDQQIEFTYEECDTALTIAPLLLLPFIENAFKHSQVAIEPDAWVSIGISTVNDEIIFHVKNTISNQAPMEILNNSGIGLENIKNRLELIYPGKYQLEINDQTPFSIDLRIKTS
ncbi:hypothetical protein EYV94_00590 [Puteibacter caeruleilacunae]|nr:hypothetical protein EYV94_00590 [Puteibacter caeruleilacunae]